MPRGSIKLLASGLTVMLLSTTACSDTNNGTMRASQRMLMGSEKPGQTIVLIRNNKGEVESIPEHPYTMYCGWNRDKSGYENPSLDFYNLTGEDIVVTLVAPEGSVSIPEFPISLPPATAIGHSSPTSPRTVQLELTVRGSFLNNFLKNVSSETNPEENKPSFYRRWIVSYEILIQNTKGDSLLRIDPELVVEGRP